MLWIMKNVLTKPEYIYKTKVEAEFNTKIQF